MRFLFLLLISIATFPAFANDIVLNNAQAGDVDSQYYLAFKYELGIDVEQNSQKAHYWYSKAAEQGDARSQYSLGYLYSEGIGVKKDMELAKQWYEKSSRQDYAEAQYALATLYYNGAATKRALAKELFEKACNGGQYEACVEYQNMQALGM